MYADTVTRSMKAAIVETERRRKKQTAYNEEHGIVPKTIIKSIRDVIEISSAPEETKKPDREMSRKEKEAEIRRLEREMRKASQMLEFELAAMLRDRIIELRGSGS
jgi:excinuclease ABC subunit B